MELQDEVKGLSAKITKMIFFPHKKEMFFPKCWPGQEQAASRIASQWAMAFARPIPVSWGVLVSTPKDSTVHWCKDREREGKHLESASCTQTSPSRYREHNIPPIPSHCLKSLSHQRWLIASKSMQAPGDVWIWIQFLPQLEGGQNGSSSKSVIFHLR